MRPVTTQKPLGSLLPTISRFSGGDLSSLILGQRTKGQPPYRKQDLRATPIPNRTPNGTDGSPTTVTMVEHEHLEYSDANASVAKHDYLEYSIF